MTNTYKWIISSLECYPNYNGLEKTVVNIHWRRQSFDGNGHIGDICGMQEIEINIGDSFVPYQDLTENRVIDWLEESIGSDAINEINDNLDRQIQNQINPPIISLPLPWAS